MTTPTYEPLQQISLTVTKEQKEWLNSKPKRDFNLSEKVRQLISEYMKRDPQYT